MQPAAMHLLDRIDHALRTRTVNADDFERYALDVLGPIFPGLAPIPGGTDWGRDGDISRIGATPMRLLATRSSTLEGVRSNMVRSLKSLVKHGQPTDSVVLANLAELSARNRSSLQRTASNHGVTVVEVYDRVFFANQLRRDGEWRTRLLGIPGDPISVSRLPPELAESPRARLPLVGRESELVALRSTTERDVVLFGLPGSGKSRLLAEVDGAVFVDRDAAIATIADDLRILEPAVVVVDDAGDRLPALRQLRQLRSSEPDLLSFQIVAVCWPDEVDQLTDEAPTADVVGLDLLERAPMDELVRSMGITSMIARHEILAQAEGRPGWAVALADVLLIKRETQDLLSGRALMGEIGRYLRRRRFHEATTDLLATIATLGGVDETQLAVLAETIGMDRADVVARLRSAARSGLVDVALSYTSTGWVKEYQVRPPMLASAVVAERLVADVPPVDLRQLSQTWPDRRAAIACAVIDAVRLGVESVRDLAQGFSDAVVTDETVSGPDRVRVVRAFGSLSPQHAHHMLGLIRRGFDKVIADGGDGMAVALEPYVVLAADFARWRLPEAMQMLFDAAAVDQRAPNPHPDHPQRKIEDLITEFHPELPSDDSITAFVADAAGDWLDAHRQEPGAWDTYADAAAAALDLGRSVALTDPGSPLTVTLHETVADPAQIVAVADNVWPSIVQRLRDASTGAINKVLDAVGKWLWIGAGYHQPFGSDLPQERVAAAQAAGRRLLADVRPMVNGHPGLAARYNAIAEQHEIDDTVRIPDDISPFFHAPEEHADWQAERSGVRAAISPTVQGWAGQPAYDVCRRLAVLRDEIEVAGLRWPPRISIACDMLADQVSDIEEWIEAALTEGLFPDAVGLLRKHREHGGRFNVDMIARAMDLPAARWSFAGTVLADQGAEPDELEAVFARLTGDDLNLFVNLGYSELPPERHRHLFTEPAPPARAAAAVAFAHRLVFDSAWAPGDLTSPWLDALTGLPDLTNVASHDKQGILDYLALHHPERFLELFVIYWARREESERPRHPSPQFFEATRLLDATHKAELLTQLDRAARRLVLQHIVGEDLSWLGEAIDTGLISLDEATAACGGLGVRGVRPPIEDLARVLVPRGAAPEDVAAIELSGAWWGPRSEHFARIAERFAKMVASSDAIVANVGRAGMEMFTRLADEERQAEHRMRVRGYE
jgi:hypothetical protein